MMPVKPIPDGYRAVTPFIFADNADTLMDFMSRAFGAEEIQRHNTPDGYVMHAEMRIGDSVIMLTDGGEHFPPLTASVHLYVPDVDATYRRAIDAGAESVSEPKDQFYGDRSAGLKDPTGNYWWLATHVEDVSPEELRRRAADFATQQSQG